MTTPNDPTTPKRPVSVSGVPLGPAGADAPVLDAATAVEVLALEPDDLDGYSIDDLSDYLEAGQRPRNPRIDESAACQMAMSALVRLRMTAAGLLEADAAEEPEPDDTWMRSVLENISLESRAGRLIPFDHDDGAAHLQITEGVVRALVRDAGDRVPGVLVGRVRLDGDVEILETAVTVQMDVTVLWGTHIPDRVSALRVAVASALATNTDLLIAAIDVTVSDVLPPRPGERTT